MQAIKVGPFRIQGRLNELHRNLFRAAYTGKDPAMRLNQYVVKFQNSDLTGKSDEHVENIEHEAKILALPRFRSHPMIAKIVHFGSFEGVPYLVTEHVPGDPLNARHDLRRVFNGICATLRVIHKHGIAHCDLKPSNIIVRSGGFPVLIDFGIAQRTGPIDQETATMVLGTYGYMAPEAASQTGIWAKSDVFSLAAVMHEIITGEPLYWDTIRMGNDGVTLATHIEGNPIERAYSPATPPSKAIREVLVRATEFHVATRYTLDQFQTALASLLPTAS